MLQQHKRRVKTRGSTLIYHSSMDFTLPDALSRFTDARAFSQRPMLSEKDEFAVLFPFFTQDYFTTKPGNKSRKTKKEVK